MMPKQLRNGSDRRGKLGGHHFSLQSAGLRMERNRDGVEIEIINDALDYGDVVGIFCD
jgi:hypothetical protein